MRLADDVADEGGCAACLLVLRRGRRLRVHGGEGSFDAARACVRETVTLMSFGRGDLRRGPLIVTTRWDEVVLVGCDLCEPTDGAPAEAAWSCLLAAAARVRLFGCVRDCFLACGLYELVDEVEPLVGDPAELVWPGELSRFGVEVLVVRPVGRWFCFGCCACPLDVGGPFPDPCCCGCVVVVLANCARPWRMLLPMANWPWTRLTAMRWRQYAEKLRAAQPALPGGWYAYPWLRLYVPDIDAMSPLSSCPSAPVVSRTVVTIE